MLTPNYLANVTDDLLELYQELEDEILRDIARRIKKANGLTATAERQAEVLIENGYSLEELEAKLKPYINDINIETENLIKNSSLKHYEDEKKAYKLANKQLIDLVDNPIAKKRIETCINRLIIGSGNITQSKGVVFQGKDVPLNVFYKRELNKAVFKIGSGAFDNQSAIRKLVNELSNSGIKEINYMDSGRNYTLESSVKMTVRTALNQLTGDISLDNAKDMEQDLMEITAHAGARPSHSVWQGKIVSLSGQDGYLNLDDIEYGEVTGFQGANCRHNWYPFFKGISERQYTEKELKNIDPDPFEYEGKEYTYYEATQKQRQIERNIRKYKRRSVMYKEIGDEKMLLASQSRLQSHRRLYKEFSKAGKLKVKNFNLYIK